MSGKSTLTTILGLTLTTVFTLSTGTPASAFEDPFAGAGSPSLSDRLLAIANAVGAGTEGVLSIHTDDDDRILASAEAGQPFNFYVSGDYVSEDATLAGCLVGAGGEPIDCDESFGRPVVNILDELVAEDTKLDPDEFKIQCHADFVEELDYCKMTWFNGSETCYLCDDNKCEPTDC